MNKSCLIAVLCVFLFPFYSTSQCPIGNCATHSTTINVSAIPNCGGSAFSSDDGDVDNNSDCESPDGENCWLFTFNKDVADVTGVSMKIGKGNGCNGEINAVITDIGGVCFNHGSTGSQNQFTFDFGPFNSMDVWVCDNSSGEVSLCLLCAENPNALPVEFSSFTGSYKNGKVYLQWSTATEIDNSHFEIQRSLDGVNFRTIDLVNGNGTSDSPIDYLYADKEPSAVAYYRLKQVDFDDQYEYSDVVFVRRGETGTLTAIPSKVNQELLLRAETLGAQNSILTITNASGQVVLQERYQNLRETEYISLDVSNFQPGIFFAALFNPNETVVTKFFVTHE